MTPRLSALRVVSLMIAVCKKEVKNQIVWPPANSMHLLFKALPPIRNVDYVSAISLIVLRDADCTFPTTFMGTESSTK